MAGPGQDAKPRAKLRRTLKLGKLLTNKSAQVFQRKPWPRRRGRQLAFTLPQWRTGLPTWWSDSWHLNSGDATLHTARPQLTSATCVTPSSSHAASRMLPAPSCRSYPSACSEATLLLPFPDFPCAVNPFRPNPDALLTALPYSEFRFLSTTCVHTTNAACILGHLIFLLIIWLYVCVCIYIYTHTHLYVTCIYIYIYI